MESDRNFDDTLVYCLHFLNPFDKSNEVFITKSIFASEAREKFLRIYKTSVSDENKKVIPQICETMIDWLKDFKEEKVNYCEFIKCVISSILYSIKYELKLRYDVLSSRDKDEIFVKIYACETWLRDRAEKLDYKLSFKKDFPGQNENSNEINKKAFMNVTPYGSINLLKIESNFGLFPIYNIDDEEVSNHGSFFTYANKSRLVISALNSRFDLSAMKKYEVMIDNYCVHQEKPLKKLKQMWAHIGAIFKTQPLDAIKHYYGEKIAFYFAWIDTYADFMKGAAIIGFAIQAIKFFFSTYDATYKILTVSFAIFLTFWATAFDQFWGRREKVLAWKWGTMNLSDVEMQRGDFVGKFEKDEVTGRMKVVEQKNNITKFKKIMSYSFILTLIFVVIGAVISIFLFRAYMLTIDELWGMILPGLLNAIQIKIMNMIYDRLAIFLNDWENHETDNLYNNHLAVKLFLFRFVNSYSSLFYLAFFAGNHCKRTCIQDLSYQLAVIFLTNMAMNTVELGMPWLKMKFKLRQETKKIRKAKKNDPSIRELIYPVEHESKLQSYESPLEDYMEMVIQFGYISLFGAALPILPVLALIELMLEIRVDAWKICNLVKRPPPNRSKDIGVWRSIIMIVTYAGAITNSGIIFITIGFFKDDLLTQILGFISLEHLILAGILIIGIIIPDVPSVVTDGYLWANRMVNEKKLYRIFFKKASSKLSNSFSYNDFLLSKRDITYYSS